MATATTGTASAGPWLPKTVQGIAFVTAAHGMFAALARRYGSVFTVNFRILGKAVVISDPIGSCQRTRRANDATTAAWRSRQGGWPSDGYRRTAEV
jgi:hypothetical protein